LNTRQIDEQSKTPTEAFQRRAKSITSGTAQSTRSRDLQAQGKQHLRAKLGYSWKAIFKNLVKADSKNSGLVSRDVFESVCEANGARLARDDLNKLVAYYGNIDHLIDYNHVSRDLRLHREGLDIFANSNKRAA
jgi:hypothetical protein